MELTAMAGIGPARAEALRAMGIISLRDLLYTLPERYEDYSTVSPCNTKKEGPVLISGTVVQSPKLSVFHGLKKVTVSIEDESGKMPVCWYNAPWIMNSLSEGQQIRLYGRLQIRNNRRILQNPKFASENEGLVPVYRSIKGLPAKTFRNLISDALFQVDDCCPETLPTEFRIAWHLCELNYAIRQAHFPDNYEALKIARRRLSFERVLLYLAYVSMSGSKKQPGIPMKFPEGQIEQYWKSQGFEPTGAQKKVLEDIATDMQKNTAMSRLVQGDVGCGKTAVAFGAVSLASAAGYQSTMMAPTEILAVQHYENARKTLEPAGIRCRLLTGSTKTKERKMILQELKNRQCDVVFGTHALISRDVEYGNLGLVITDEQHRFGVNQRSSLQMKGKTEETLPHVLVMSATPIPRTLALILYGDLDLSVIDEMPKGRIPVKTRIVPEHKREDMYKFLRKEIAKGKQAYIVCPLVEEDDEKSELHSAKALFESLRKNEMQGLRVALTWGSQKTEEKDRVLHEFVEGKYDVLVSTTVIEVGVNNPNATIMVIENAERYGLSQLHQLRGRVGRGKDESWCFLFAEPSEKLNSFCSTNDGFVIAQKDLELRGPGDLAGTRQSGEPGNGFLFGDIRMLEEVTDCVRQLHRNPVMKKALEVIEKHAEEYFTAEGRRIALN
ncbi:ATP-dependent DNA helicase RecG [Clostridiales bacterium FE2011]|nr:ATP-dependent DNA helicase RecG [Clostridiales bacterium FE2011]QTE75226.1 ATP-dependent DNA helicase RecG [Clostridiales bacterium FE2010]